MTPRTPRHAIALCAALTLAAVCLFAQRGGGFGGGGNRDHGQAGGKRDSYPPVTLSVALGRPTGRSITASIISPSAIEAKLQYGTAPGLYTTTTDPITVPAFTPTEATIAPLASNTRYYYRLLTRRAAHGDFAPAFAEQSFTTARAPGSTFTFDLQGDSHPERPGVMFDDALYRQTLARVAADHPDFYLMLGDDFSIEHQIGDGNLSQSAVDPVYQRQRSYLAPLSASTPIFLVNGNHEEAGGWMLDGSATNPAVCAGSARTRFFPLPAPDSFYTGDTTPVPGIGLLRDYYAFTWGDALFVVLDPYWHSPVQVDATPGGGHGVGNGGGHGGGGGGSNHGAGHGNRDNQDPGNRDRNLWQVTLGDAQYQWLRQTLASSHARYKFVFAHHILGTGRGGIEEASTYEWGGYDPRGAATFRQMRPSWPEPIHQLFVRYGVTIFFQGHDHLFAHQLKDGVVYQETPNPADPTYTAFNRDAYRSGDVLPNSGHLRVTVSPANVRVEYIRSYLPADATAAHPDGELAFSYTVTSRNPK